MTASTDSVKINISLMENTFQITHTQGHCVVSQKAKIGEKNVTITLNFDQDISDEQAQQAMQANLTKAAIVAVAFQLGEENAKHETTCSLTLYKDTKLSRTFTKVGSTQEETEIHSASEVRAKIIETRRKTQFVANKIIGPKTQSVELESDVKIEIEKPIEVKQTGEKEIKEIKEKIEQKLKNLVEMAENETGFLKKGKHQLDTIASKNFICMSLKDMEEEFKKIKELIEEEFSNLKAEMPFEISGYYKFIDKHFKEWHQLEQKNQR